jgi:hypothetical protein
MITELERCWACHRVPSHRALLSSVGRGLAICEACFSARQDTAANSGVCLCAPTDRMEDPKTSIWNSRVVKKWVDCRRCLGVVK